MSVLLAGFMVVGALAFLALKFGPNFIKKLLGMDILVDIIITIALCWIFAITGTISGLLTGIFVGFIVSMVLYFGKKLFSHQKLVRVGNSYQWVNVPGEWMKA